MSCQAFGVGGCGPFPLSIEELLLYRGRGGGGGGVRDDSSNDFVGVRESSSWKELLGVVVSEPLVGVRGSFSKEALEGDRPSTLLRVGEMAGSSSFLVVRSCIKWARRSGRMSWLPDMTRRFSVWLTPKCGFVRERMSKRYLLHRECRAEAPRAVP